MRRSHEFARCVAAPEENDVMLAPAVFASPFDGLLPVQPATRGQARNVEQA
jgi:hypothetical protein